MIAKSPIRAALGCALGIAVLCAAGPARAGDDDVSWDTKIIRNFLEGLGLKRDGEAITYQERAPLVIPPSRNLPAPEQSDASASNPAWPKDPDIARAKEQARLEKNRDVEAERVRDEGRLTSAQMTPGRKSGQAVRRRETAATASRAPSDSSDRLSPTELGSKSIFGNMFSGSNEKPARFSGEPARASLTDPPVGYQTPSPVQPYGLGKSSAPPKADDYYADHGTTGIDK